MYTAFYGLREKPFALSPDPRFLYLAGSHREALAHLLYGIEQGEGFISITGEVGTGKTTLCRTLLERLDRTTELAFLFNPSRTALELLQSICAEFGLPAEGLTRRSLMAQLNSFLVAKKREGRRVLLIIDEAQTLSENTLEQVRLLSNLETSREKLIQILLLGQPELDRKLDERGLRQLRQRISVRWKLEPLSPHETRAYVRHRLSVAAGEPKDLFSDAALREVHRRTGGVPRLVNQLCDRALLGGYAARAAQIGPRLVRAAAREIPDAQRSRADRRGAGAGRGAGIGRGSGMGRSAESRRGLASGWLAGRRRDADRDEHDEPRSGDRPLAPGEKSRPWMLFGASLALIGLSLFAGLQVGRYGLTDSLRASVFKPDALRTDDSERSQSAGATPPAVGANAPSAGYSGKRIDGTGPLGVALGPRGGPPLVELIGYVPEAMREGLRLTPGQLDDELSGSPAADPVARAESLATRGAVEETALAEGLLPQLLAARSAQRALLDSQSALLERFGRSLPPQSPVPASASDLQLGLESRGLAATPFEGGSIELLRRLDHPVAIPLAVRGEGSGEGSGPSDSRWVAITGFQGARARVAGLVRDQVVTITIRELEAYWLETGILVWERFEPIPSLLATDDEGAGVLWLQNALAELRFLDAAPTGRFDESTGAALRRFQRDRGLLADGLAGPITQIALYAGLDRYPVPRLSQASGGPQDGLGVRAASELPRRSSFSPVDPLAPVGAPPPREPVSPAGVATDPATTPSRTPRAAAVARPGDRG